MGQNSVALTIILLSSILFQFAAVYFALRMVGLTRKWLGWILIATAIAMMAARRLIVFFHWIFGDTEFMPNLTAELVSMTISILMLIGLAWVAPAFVAIRREKQLEEEKRQTLQKIFDATFEGIVVHEGGKILFVNEAFAKMFNYDKDQIIGTSVLDLARDDYKSVLTKNIQDGFEGLYEAIGIKRNGDQIYVEISGKPFDFDGRQVRLAAVRDVTYRKDAQQALLESESRLRSIFENAIIGLYQSTPAGRILLANPALVRMLGFNSFTEINDVNIKSLGYDAGYEREEFIKRIEADGEVIGMESQWKHKDGSMMYVRESARAVRDENGRTVYYEGTIEDITERKNAEHDLQESIEKLRLAMSGTVMAMGMILETRDPYTAGHQRRVAELACALGAELDLDDDVLDALKMAASVHDLGKISVPAEILTKPGQLSEIENNMLKNHDQVGHDILKAIDFPWPVAQIVYQHHERYDGSGYPRGIAGEDIMIEARILMVADVVEAMASHRPYRPALGVDKALEEIKQGKGILFDPIVVDACITLFTEKGFRFDSKASS